MSPRRVEVLGVMDIEGQFFVFGSLIGHYSKGELNFNKVHSEAGIPLKDYMTQRDSKIPVLVQCEGKRVLHRQVDQVLNTASSASNLVKYSNEGETFEVILPLEMYSRLQSELQEFQSSILGIYFGLNGLERLIAEEEVKYAGNYSVNAIPQYFETSGRVSVHNQEFEIKELSLLFRAVSFFQSTKSSDKNYTTWQKNKGLRMLQYRVLPVMLLCLIINTMLYSRLFKLQSSQNTVTNSNTYQSWKLQRLSLENQDRYNHFKLLHESRSKNWHVYMISSVANKGIELNQLAHSPVEGRITANTAPSIKQGMIVVNGEAKEVADIEDFKRSILDLLFISDVELLSMGKVGDRVGFSLNVYLK